jgi:AraC-like DNA-binding protein/mannose-6-phosphate isomerase-like protein (cupin superfamily)
MQSILGTRSDDIVSDVLAAVRVRTTVYCRSEMRAPWGFGVDAHGNPSFHVVVRGRCWLEADGDGHPCRLRSGDLVLLPRGPTHWLRDEPSSPVRWLEDILSQTPPDSGNRLRHGGNGALTELVCGGFVLEGEGVDPVLRALPDVVHVSGVDGTPAPWVAATLDLVTAVTSSDAPGAEAVVARLAETIVMQALRSALAKLHADDPAQIEALQDPQIAAAVRLIHAEPARSWTVESLAFEVGYSRSAFASRFRRVVGESPFAYLTRARLAAGAALLDRTKMPVAQVATSVGYANEASFGRAFRRTFGVAPGTYRGDPSNIGANGRASK